MSLFCIHGHVGATIKTVTSTTKIEPPLEIEFIQQFQMIFFFFLWFFYFFIFLFFAARWFLPWRLWDWLGGGISNHNRFRAPFASLAPNWHKSKQSIAFHNSCISLMITIIDIQISPVSTNRKDSNNFRVYKSIKWFPRFRSEPLNYETIWN